MNIRDAITNHRLCRSVCLVVLYIMSTSLSFSLSLSLSLSLFPLSELPRILISVCISIFDLRNSHALAITHSSLLCSILAHQFHQSQNAEEPEQAERL